MKAHGVGDSRSGEKDHCERNEGQCGHDRLRADRGCVAGQPQRSRPFGTLRLVEDVTAAIRLFRRWTDRFIAESLFRVAAETIDD